MSLERLEPCPSAPNCVSSLAKDAKHRVEPIPWQGTAAEALDSLTKIIDQQPRAEVVKRGSDYLHAVFRSRIFRFADDVEFVPCEKDQVIHVRASSRRGYYDLGTNRRRVERLRHLLIGQS